MGGINFKAFDLGGHEIARRVWRDYYAKVDAIVFLVDAVDRERFAESKKARGIGIAWVWVEAGVMTRLRPTGALVGPVGRPLAASVGSRPSPRRPLARSPPPSPPPFPLTHLLAPLNPRFPPSKTPFPSPQELDALLSDDALATVPFLVLGNKIDVPQAASEDELRLALGLQNYTTGKGRVDLKDANIRPIEVFMCSVVRRMGYGDGFRWVSQYIK